jgi:lysophospholipase L1-like esterase
MRLTKSLSMRSALKVIGYNLLILFVLANIFYWAILTYDLISKLVKARDTTPGDYHSFIGWRHLPTALPDVHVDAGPYPQRRTIGGGTSVNQKAYFFGGSTMWGLGVADRDTIPSQFAESTGVRSENYGEIGYTAHQGLVLLLQLLQAGHRPDLVVFYDGVNDVSVKCHRELTPQSHGRERDINSLLEGRDHPSSFHYHLRGAMRLAERIRGETSKATGDTYDCDRFAGKAEAIAANLVQDWQFAKLLVEAFGGRFVGILQPVAFVGRPKLDGLVLNPGLGRQFGILYPLIQQKVSGLPYIHDLTDAFDGETRFYTDYNHVTSAGNKLVAEHMATKTKTIRPSSGR